MSELTRPQDVTTPEQWIERSEEALAKDPKCYLADFRLITFDRIKAAPKDFQHSYFEFVSTAAYTAQEIAKESGTIKPEIQKLMKCSGVTYKTSLKYSQNEPMSRFTQKGREKLRNWIRTNKRAKIIDLEAILKLQESFNFTCKLPWEFLIDTLADCKNQEHFEETIRLLLRLPKPEEQIISKPSHSRLFNTIDGRIRTDSMLDNSLYQCDDVYDHQVGVKVPRISFAVKEEDKMNVEKKQATKILTIADVIKKTPDKMGMNDVEPVMNGAPVEPRFDKKSLFDKEYLEKLFGYFEHVTNVMALQLLLNVKNDSAVGLGKFMKNAGIQHRGSRKDCYFYETMAFYGWVKGRSTDAAMDYYYATHPKEDVSQPDETPTQPEPEIEEEAEMTKIETVGTPEEQEPVEETSSPAEAEPQSHRARSHGYVEVFLYGVKSEILRAIAELMDKYAGIIDVDRIEI